MFPIVYVPPLQSGDLNSGIDRIHKCVDSSLQFKRISELRRCHELAQYVMGQVEDPVSVDFSPKLGHCLTLMLREGLSIANKVSKTDSTDATIPKTDLPTATIQVQLFDKYAAVADCIKPGNLIMLTRVRVDISMMCASNRQMPHSELQISAKPVYQKNFKMFFMPCIHIYSPLEETKWKITRVSACKSLKAAPEKIYVNVSGVITASTPFEKLNGKEWTCFITIADQTVHCEYLYKCCSSTSSLLIKVVSSTCLATFEIGHIIRISHLQITEQYDVILGLMQMDCQSGLFHVAPDDTISFLPIHHTTRIQATEWQRVKEICCWWTSLGIQENKSDVLPSYLLSKGFMVNRLNVADEVANVQAEDGKVKPELLLNRVQNPRKRKIPEGCNKGEKKIDCSMRTKQLAPSWPRTSTNSPVKKACVIVPSRHVKTSSFEITHKSTAQSRLSHVGNDEFKQSAIMENMPDSPEELKWTNVKVPVIPKDRKQSMAKLITLDKLCHDMYFDIDCQVVGYYCAESFDKVVLKIWDGAKCPYLKKNSFSPGSLIVKFEDPNLADIEDYCASVEVSEIHMQHAEIIKLCDIVRLRNVHACSGILNISGWHHDNGGISIYQTNAFRSNLENNLTMLRKKLRKEEYNLVIRPHCPMTNLQSGILNAPSTDSLCNANILSTYDAFTPFETMKQNFTSIKSKGNVVTESLKLLPEVDKGLVEYTTSALFDCHASKPQNKRLQPSFNKVGQEDAFFDIFCQVVGCYHNAQPLKVILKVWDGTKCQSAQCRTHYDSWTPVFEDPHLDDIDEYCVCVNVYDEYMEMTRKLQLNDIVTLYNIRSRNGVFSMHGGRIKQRKIVTCPPNSTIAKSLITDLNTLRQALSKNKNADADVRGCQEISVGEVVDEVPRKEVPIEPNKIVNSVSEFAPTTKTAQENLFPNVLCATPIKDCPKRTSSVARIKRSPIPGKFNFLGAVFDIHPRANNVAELVRWFCVSCENTYALEDLKDFKALERYKYQCPCNVSQNETNSTTVPVQVLEPIFVFYITLCDPKYDKLEVIVYGPHADTFFHDSSAIEFVEHEYIRERFAALFETLCSSPGYLTKSSFAMHCLICSTAANDGNTVYSVVHTKLKPRHEILRINR